MTYEPDDLMILMQAILKSAVADYINGQCVERRTSAEAKRTFETAVDLLFDTGYEAMKLHLPEGDAMTLRDIVDFAQPENYIRLEELRRRVQNEAIEASKDIDTQLTIGSHIVLYGIAYSVIKSNENKVDFENRLVYCSSKTEYVNLLLQIAAYHSEARISSTELKVLSEALYEMIRLNHGFIKLK
jgi:hypothetical protein